MRWLKATAFVKRSADAATEEEVLVNSDHIIGIAGDANGSLITANGPSNPIREAKTRRMLLVCVSVPGGAGICCCRKLLRCVSAEGGCRWIEIGCC